MPFGDCLTKSVTLTLSTPWMHAHLEIIACKFGRNPAISVVEEGICAKCLQADDGRRAIALAYGMS